MHGYLLLSRLANPKGSCKQTGWRRRVDQAKPEDFVQSFLDMLKHDTYDGKESYYYFCCCWISSHVYMMIMQKYSGFIDTYRCMPGYFWHTSFMIVVFISLRWQRIAAVRRRHGGINILARKRQCKSCTCSHSPCASTAFVAFLSNCSRSYVDVNSEQLRRPSLNK